MVSSTRPRHKEAAMQLTPRLLTTASLLVLTGCIEPISFPDQPGDEEPQQITTPEDGSLRTADTRPIANLAEEAIFTAHGVREVPSDSSHRLQASTFVIAIHGDHARPLSGSLERVSAVGIRSDAPGYCLIEFEFEIDAIEVVEGNDIVTVELTEHRKTFDVLTAGYGAARIAVDATLTRVHPLETTSAETAAKQRECMAYFDVSMNWTLEYEVTLDVRDVDSMNLNPPGECSTRTESIDQVRLIEGASKKLPFRLMGSNNEDVTWALNGPESIDFAFTPARRLSQSRITFESERGSVTVTARAPGIDTLRSEFGNEVEIETFATERIEDFQIDFFHPVRGYLELGEGGQIWNWSGSDERDAPHVIAAVNLSLIHISEPTRPY